MNSVEDVSGTSTKTHLKAKLCYYSQTKMPFGKEVKKMATNPPTGDGHRNGAVRKRSQFQNPINKIWYKRDPDTGRIMDGKFDGSKFKGVRREK